METHPLISESLNEKTNSLLSSEKAVQLNGQKTAQIPQGVLAKIRNWMSRNFTRAGINNAIYENSKKVVDLEELKNKELVYGESIPRQISVKIKSSVKLSGLNVKLDLQNFQQRIIAMPAELKDKIVDFTKRRLEWMSRNFTRAGINAVIETAKEEKTAVKELATKKFVPGESLKNQISVRTKSLIKLAGLNVKLNLKNFQQKVVTIPAEQKDRIVDFTKRSAGFLANATVNAGTNIKEGAIKTATAGKNTTSQKFKIITNLPSKINAKLNGSKTSQIPNNIKTKITSVYQEAKNRYNEKIAIQDDAKLKKPEEKLEQKMPKEELEQKIESNTNEVLDPGLEKINSRIAALEKEAKLLKEVIALRAMMNQTDLTMNQGNNSHNR